jgi:hypothetical protein
MLVLLVVAPASPDGPVSDAAGVLTAQGEEPLRIVSANRFRERGFSPIGREGVDA